MIFSEKLRVAHLRDGFTVAKVGSWASPQPTLASKNAAKMATPTPMRIESLTDRLQ